VTDDRGEAGEGGESACYAHLICPECGTVLDGTGHRDGCTRTESKSRIEMSHDVDPILGD
jgi:hypothetical protein